MPCRDHAPRRLAAERAAGQRDGPPPRPQHGRPAVRSKRRLAATVGPDDRDDLALADRQREVVQHLDLAVADGQIPDLEQAHAGTPRYAAEHGRIALHIGRRAVGDHAAFVEHRHPVGGSP
jgi:hypothetical protein